MRLSSNQPKDVRHFEYIRRFDREYPPEKYQPLGCLSCKRCELRTDTDFTAETPRIHCGKINRPRPIQWTDCLIADPRPAHPATMGRASYETGIGNHHNGEPINDFGDCQRRPTPALLAFLRIHWATMDLKRLITVTGRSKSVLYRIALKAGISETRIAYQAKARYLFTPAQDRRLEALYRDQNWWPNLRGYHLNSPGRPAIEARRREVETIIASLGEFRTFTQCEYRLRRLRKKHRQNQRGARN